MNRVSGKRVIIVGGTSGIGEEIVRLFLSEGATVVFCGRSNEAGKLIEGQAKNSKYIYCDITDKDNIRSFFNDAIKYLGGLDIAINNAGISGAILPFHETDESSLNAVMSTNFFGAWHCMQYEINHLINKNQPGCILNISSTSGLIGNALGLAPYAASKHALIGLTKSTALEYAKNNIRINALCPGFVDTPMTERATEISKSLKRRLAMMHPVGRMGSKREIADAALYLCSDEASFTTGSCMVIDGGLTA